MAEANIIQGHVLDVLAGMEAESMSCVVTSPPYWSLRKYEAPDVMWGGNPGCEHEWTSTSKDGAVEAYAGTGRWQHTDHSRDETPGDWGRVTQGSGLCLKCGAWRGQYGLEPTPELYVEHTLDVLRAIRRVLRPDGVVWWNIGDGYASNPAKGGSGAGGKEETWHGGVYDRRSRGEMSLPAKNLILMPFRVALAAQADGWWVRSVIIWSKPNCMPESCKDRPTTAHEYVLMLTKSARYWYDSEAAREAPSAASMARKALENFAANPGRNMRSVWTFPTAQTPEAHFATFPEALPRRCIEASCPQYFCPSCGTPGPDTRSGNTAIRERYWRRYHRGKAAGGLVLDPFTGIGTTGIIAKRFGRRFVGIELSAAYVKMAREKLGRTAVAWILGMAAADTKATAETATQEDNW